MLRNLIHEKVLVGPVVPDFHGPVARLVELPTGGCRIDWWVKGSGWTEAPKGAFTLASFMPGYTRPASAKDAALHDIPASELDDITAEEIELAKHEMSRPRKIYGSLFTVLPAPRHRAKLVHLLKERSFDLAARLATPSCAFSPS
jgi:hypothetical protein